MPTRLSAFLHHPLVRIGIALALCLGIGIAAHEGIALALPAALPQITKDILTGAATAILLFLAYTILFHRYERRPVTELSGRHLPAYLVTGTALGAILAAVIIGIQYIFRDYTIIARRPFAPLLPFLLNTFIDAFIAETLIIGILFRITEEWLGSYRALLAMFILFLCIHWSSPEARFPGALGAALNGGLMLCVAYMYTRSLWFPVAIHFAWDFTLAAVFGCRVNDYTMAASLFDSRTTGSDLIAGGFYGPQGSLQASLLCLITAAVLLSASRRKGRIRQ